MDDTQFVDDIMANRSLGFKVTKMESTLANILEETCPNIKANCANGPTPVIVIIAKATIAISLAIHVEDNSIRNLSLDLCWW